MDKNKATTETKRTAPDKSPENDLRKARGHLRSARAKWIREGDEESGGKALAMIGHIEQLLNRKPAEG